MDILNQHKSSNPIIVRLKSEHALLSTEINELNRDMLALRDIIRYKQRELRVINKALIHKATRGPFLTVVQTKTTSQTSKKTNKNADTPFVCIQGGKC